MSLFTNLFSSKAPEKPPVKPEIVVLAGALQYDRGILWEVHFQSALESICGRRAPKGVQCYETARLIPEDQNPQDKTAVRVEIRGKRVGYLKREHALLLRQQLKATGKPIAWGQCQALITGGWVSSDGRKGLYEVWLDLPSLYS